MSGTIQIDCNTLSLWIVPYAYINYYTPEELFPEISLTQ